jgi:hypothetical protein
VEYNVEEDRFTVYVSPKLQTSEIIKEIMERFFLPADRTSVQSDAQYW